MEEGQTTCESESPTTTDTDTTVESYATSSNKNNKTTTITTIVTTVVTTSATTTTTTTTTNNRRKRRNTKRDETKWDETDSKRANKRAQIDKTGDETNIKREDRDNNEDQRDNSQRDTIRPKRSESRYFTWFPITFIQQQCRIIFYPMVDLNGQIGYVI